MSLPSEFEKLTPEEISRLASTIISVAPQEYQLKVILAVFKGLDNLTSEQKQTLMTILSDKSYGDAIPGIIALSLGTQPTTEIGGQTK